MWKYLFYHSTPQKQFSYITRSNQYSTWSAAAICNQMVNKTPISALQFESLRNTYLGPASISPPGNRKNCYIGSVENVENDSCLGMKNKFYYEGMSQKRLEMFGSRLIDNLIETVHQLNFPEKNELAKVKSHPSNCYYTCCCTETLPAQFIPVTFSITLDSVKYGTKSYVWKHQNRAPKMLVDASFFEDFNNI